MAPPNDTHLGRGRHAEGASADPTDPVKQVNFIQAVSANPAAMRTYATDAAEKTDELRTLIGEVGVALANYRQNAVVAGAGFAPQNELDWHDGWTDADGAGTGALDALLDLCDDFDHLDAFVGSVADAVFEAEGLDDDDPRADQVYTITAGDIAEHGDIDSARREFSNENAQQDAAELQTLLDDLDIDPHATDLQLDINGYAVNPMDAELTQEAYDQLVAMAGRMDDENYASTVYNELGPVGTDALMQFIDRVAIDHEFYDTLPDDIDVDADVLQPLAGGFAAATHTMDQATIDEYLAIGDSAHGQLHLSMLLSADGAEYNSQFLGDAAGLILVSGRNNDLDSLSRPLFEPDGPHEAVLETLAQNPEASWHFVSGSSENLEYILRPSEDPEQAALVFEGAFLQAPLDDPDLYPEALDLYGDVVNIVGDGNIPDELRIAAAGSTWLYLDDIGQQAAHGTREGDFVRPDMVRFFAELGRNEDAVALLGQSFSIWSAARSSSLVADPDFTLADVEETYLPVAMLMGAAWDGLDRAEAAQAAWIGGTQRGAAVALGIGLALIPEPTSTAVGLGLIIGSELAPHALNETVEHAAENISSVDGNDMQRQTVYSISVGLAQAIANDRGIPMPDIPASDEEFDDYLPGPGEEGWVNEVRDVLHQSSTEYDGNPVRELEGWAHDQYESYDPDDHWTPYP